MVHEDGWWVSLGDVITMSKCVPLTPRLSAILSENFTSSMWPETISSLVARDVVFDLGSSGHL